MGIKLLLGGSPCTHWSIAQTKDRETEPSGIGWELFLNYRIARDKYQPDYFIYENNKSMAPAIWAQITKELGVEPILINSALVSAQNRQRFYWVGKRNANGTYSQLNVEQPEDRNIYVKDIISDCDIVPYKGGAMVRTKDNLSKPYNGLYQIGSTGLSGGQSVRVYDINGKAVTMKALGGGGGAKTGLYMIDGRIYSLNERGMAKMQTVQNTYKFPCKRSNSMSMLGNGWTVDVIVHILSHILGITTKPVEVLSMYDGMSCGHIALDKLGANVERYYATEIDKYAIKTTMENYPNTVQLGDAFQVRDDEWNLLTTKFSKNTDGEE